MGIHDKKIEGVPQFVSYFVPVVEILRDLGGQARPRQVFEEIIKRYDIPDVFLKQTNTNGQSKFKNRVAWARFYLTKAGILTSPKRGIWALTEEAKTAPFSEAKAVELFHVAHAVFKGGEDEEVAPETEGTVAETNYWFVGAMWDQGDQTERFLDEGVWQNGYDDKFANLVKQMKVGDRIAIKAAFVRKHDVPFENHGRPVSAMKIKAVGTITENPGDGLAVKVTWSTEGLPREWYFYTFSRLLKNPMAYQSAA